MNRDNKHKLLQQTSPHTSFVLHPSSTVSRQPAGLLHQTLSSFLNSPTVQTESQSKPIYFQHDSNTFVPEQLMNLTQKSEFKKSNICKIAGRKRSNETLSKIQHSDEHLALSLEGTKRNIDLKVQQYGRGNKQCSIDVTSISNNTQDEVSENKGQKSVSSIWKSNNQAQPFTQHTQTEWHALPTSKGNFKTHKRNSLFNSLYYLSPLNSEVQAPIIACSPILNHSDLLQDDDSKTTTNKQIPLPKWKNSRQRLQETVNTSVTDSKTDFIPNGTSTKLGSTVILKKIPSEKLTGLNKTLESSLLTASKADLMNQLTKKCSDSFYGKLIQQALTSDAGQNQYVSNNSPFRKRLDSIKQNVSVDVISLVKNILYEDKEQKEVNKREKDQSLDENNNNRTRNDFHIRQEDEDESQSLNNNLSKLNISSYKKDEDKKIMDAYKTSLENSQDISQAQLINISNYKFKKINQDHQKEESSQKLKFDETSNNIEKEREKCPKLKAKLFSIIQNKNMIVVHTSQNKDFMNPSQRKDAVFLAQWYEEMLNKVQTDSSLHNYSKTFEQLQLVHQACISEIIRQVSMHCNERGQLLKRVWESLMKLIVEGIDQQQSERHQIEMYLLDQITDAHQICRNKIDEYAPQIEELKRLVEKKDGMNSRIILEFKYLKKKNHKLEKLLMESKNNCFQIENEYNELIRQISELQQSNHKDQQKMSSLFSQQLDSMHLLNSKNINNVKSNYSRQLQDEIQQMKQEQEQYEQTEKESALQNNILQSDLDQLEENAKFMEIQQSIQDNNDNNTLSQQENIEIEGYDGARLMLVSTATQVEDDLIIVSHTETDTNDLLLMQEIEIQTESQNIVFEQTQTPAEWMEMQDSQAFILSEANKNSHHRTSSFMRLHGNKLKNVSSSEEEEEESQQLYEEQEEYQMYDEAISEKDEFIENDEMNALNSIMDYKQAISAKVSKEVSIASDLDEEKSPHETSLRYVLDDSIQQQQQEQQQQQQNSIESINKSIVRNMNSQKNSKVEIQLKEQVQKDISNLQQIMNERRKSMSQTISQIITNNLLKENSFINKEQMGQIISEDDEFQVQEDILLHKIYQKTQDSLISYIKQRISKTQQLLNKANNKLANQDMYKYTIKELQELIKQLNNSNNDDNLTNSISNMQNSIQMDSRKGSENSLDERDNFNNTSIEELDHKMIQSQQFVVTNQSIDSPQYFKHSKSTHSSKIGNLKSNVSTKNRIPSARRGRSDSKGRQSEPLIKLSSKINAIEDVENEIKQKRRDSKFQSEYNEPKQNSRQSQFLIEKKTKQMDSSQFIQISMQEQDDSQDSTIEQQIQQQKNQVADMFKGYKYNFNNKRTKIKKKSTNLQSSPNADAALNFVVQFQQKPLKNKKEKIAVFTEVNTKKYITQIYNDKIKQLKSIDNTNPLHNVAYDFFLNKFGFKKMAEKSLSQFLKSLQYHNKLERARVFLRFYGIDDSIQYDNDDYNFYMECMNQLDESIHPLLQQLGIYNVPKVIDLLNKKFENQLNSKILSKLKAEIEQFKFVTNEISLKNKQLIDQDIALQLLLSAKLEQKKISFIALKPIYLAADIDNDQTIGLNEFLVITRHIEKKLTYIKMLQLFWYATDLVDEITGEKTMSFIQFAQISVENNLFDKNKQKLYLHQIEEWDEIKNADILIQKWASKKEIIRSRLNCSIVNIKSNLYYQMLRKIDEYVLQKHVSNTKVSKKRISFMLIDQELSPKSTNSPLSSQISIQQQSLQNQQGLNHSMISNNNKPVTEEDEQEQKQMIWLIYRLLDDESKRLIVDPQVEALIPSQLLSFGDILSGLIEDNKVFPNLNKQIKA